MSSFGPFTGYFTFPLTSGGFVVNDGYVGPLILTTNALTTIYTLAVPASTAVDIIATVIGWDNADGYTYRADFSATVVRASSTSPTFVSGSPIPLNVRNSTGASSWTGASMSISGNNVILQVGGANGVTTHWSCTFNTENVS